jgi:ADP-heptose:LPS heptosyltransferase
LKNSKNNLIVIYGGIGDALLFTPALKACEYKPDVIFLYRSPELKILKENNLVNQVFKIESKLQLLLFCLKHKNFYNTIFLNHLCGGSFLLKALALCSVKLITNSSHYINAANKKLEKIKVLNIVHDAIQNYFLLHQKVPQLTSSDFELTTKSSSIALPDSFIAVQLSAGNNQTPYKNWPIKHWSAFFELALKKYPAQKFVLLGHKDEEDLVQQLTFKHQNIISLIGKTSIEQSFEVIAKSKLFVGLDGGLLHVAVACNKPTFTIWGGSSPLLYGYNNLLGAKHKEVKQHLNCMPCNAWQNANTSKTKNPLQCTDFACLQTLTPNVVFGAFEEFYIFV